MLAEKRHEYILQELKRKGSITVNEIKKNLEFQNLQLEEI